MDITYYGAGTVKLTGKTLTLLIDPFTPDAKLGKLPQRINVVVKTSDEQTGEVQDVPTFKTPGEFEVGGVMIAGIAARLHTDDDGHRGTIFSIKSDGVNVVALGNIADELSQGQVEPLGKIDVLIIPVGGNGLTLDGAAAAKLVAQLEPAYVIPVHFGDGTTHYPVPQDGVDGFLKEVGSQSEEIPKLKVNARELPTETEVVLLKRTSA